MDRSNKDSTEQFDAIFIGAGYVRQILIRSSGITSTDTCARLCLVQMKVCLSMPAYMSVTNIQKDHGTFQSDWKLVLEIDYALRPSSKLTPLEPRLL